MRTENFERTLALIGSGWLAYQGLGLLRRFAAGWREHMSKDEIFAARRSLFCAAQSVSYANTNPLLVLSGRGTRLFDERGVAYLDTRNNVGHVGHTHPRVAAAVARQVGTINTNTRYLHPNIVRLGARLLATMPPPLCDGRIFLVNSGSEANDLALRLAHAHADATAATAAGGSGAASAEVLGARDVVVLEHAYHGHTVGALSLSPYKFDHAGGGGRPPTTHIAPAPDTYRGPHRGADAAAAYAAGVAAACGRAPGGRVAALFVESGMSVAGVILPPAGYLATAFAAVRAAGGVCVCDEVQTGLGRLGDRFWAFQPPRGGETISTDATPDIVTMGKPLGNGMPLAAVVCTAAVADAFAARGIEYFNTFGGNPVCCAAGNAVLDVLEEEGLQANAARSGAALRARLAELAAQPRGRLIGDVRGAGLFLGIEFVRDRTTLEPATAETSLICSRLKDEHRILTSIDGPHDNVIVVKPPLCFSPADAAEFITALGTVLGNLGEVDKDAAHTPT